VHKSKHSAVQHGELKLFPNGNYGQFKSIQQVGCILEFLKQNNHPTNCTGSTVKRVYDGQESLPIPEVSKNEE
jgi:hypothetical protein